MSKINYPLIVSDFDGTLVNANGTISAENKREIERYCKAGGAFAISTGRMPAGILPRVKELGLKGIVSACQGSVILDIESGEVLSEGRIPYETTLQIIEKMEEMGLHIHLYDMWEYYCNMDDEALKFYESTVRLKAKLVLDKPLSEFVKETKFAAYKVLAMVRAEDNEKIVCALKQAAFEGCTVTRSNRHLVEVVNANYSKGTAIQFLSKYYKIPIEKTIAIGDQSNDLPMIEVAGLGVAVQNADAGLKAKANYICESTNEQHAVAEAIQKFGFYEEKE